MRKSSEIREAFADRSRLDGYKSFFLVGIGGAGMSALARMLKHRGYAVEGTDSTPSSETDRLQTEGIPVRIGHSGEGITPEHAVVLTDAIDLSLSPEVSRARGLGMPLFRRSQVLGWLLKDRHVIAVTGTHGKTTTTGMIGAGLKAAGMDPLIVVGASVPEFGGPVVEGKGEWAVVEACEAYDSFHDIDPAMVVLTNLELDHVDFHGNWENLRDTVVRFVRSLPADGTLVFCSRDEGAREVARLSGVSLIEGYESSHLDVELKEHHLEHLRFKMPGEHNRLNASGAMTAISVTRAPLDEALRGIANFSGAERRLQVLKDEPITVIDDYAHHPTEIEASLRALNDRYPYRRLVVVYQPHLYSRTESLIPEFAKALSLADEVVLTDIYPAREDPIAGVSSARIAELVSKPVLYVPNRHLLPRKVAAMARPGDVVVGMGAGNIAEFAPAFIRELDRGSYPARRVAVIYGGDSAEREVSILSGRCVYDALKRKGYETQLVDVSEILIKSGDLSRFTGADRPDVAFLAVHGTNAEDGAIQGLFELLHIPYTGSGIQASALAMDKQLTKALLRERGLRVPEGSLTSTPKPPSPVFRAPGEEAGQGSRREKTEEEGPEVRGFRPVIVKPNAQGSTVGLSFVEREEDLKPAIEKALQYDSAALVEEWIVGMEISVPVLGDRALPPVEIAPTSGKYDFESKYTPGATEEIVPARLPEAVLKWVQGIALKAHRALGCVGATRTDMIVRRTSSTPQPPSSVFRDPGEEAGLGPRREKTEEGGSGLGSRRDKTEEGGSGLGSRREKTEEGGSGDYEVFVLEVNTLPGMTATSLLPNSARAAGIEFDDLVEWLVEDALARSHAKT
ncbi:MAG TPA: UDP-N-acetylmuramate--L-alanine ligase [Fimbriimonadaceae bacterium]|nr:UDP-N-acetylmuramate--L-alanine ligase [Fimbriimonadaceae bacterium]